MTGFTQRLDGSLTHRGKSLIQWSVSTAPLPSRSPNASLTSAGWSEAPRQSRRSVSSHGSRQETTEPDSTEAASDDDDTDSNEEDQFPDLDIDSDIETYICIKGYSLVKKIGEGHFGKVSKLSQGLSLGSFLEEISLLSLYN